MIMGGILAIRSPNYVQIWKGSDQKTVFFQGEKKNIQPTTRLCYVKPL